MANFIFKIVKVLFLSLDRFIYAIIAFMYQLFIQISKAQIFDETIYETFASRIYGLLGLIMVFKVAISFLTYVVNPDSLDDKNQGAGKLVQNIIVTLAILAVVPWAFKQAREVQNLAIGGGSYDLMQALVFGGGGSCKVTDQVAGDASRESTNWAGQYLAVQTFSAFYTCNPGESCNIDAFKNTPLCPKNNERIPSAKDFINIWSFSEVWDGDADYIVLLSTACGVFVVLILIQFCFDIAIRTVKFAFLQLIAPIPVLSRIDPKSSKDSMFSKWVSQCVKTYLDIFIRVFALYFSIFLISNIQVATETSGFYSLLVKAFVIIGALMFAKQLPELIESLTGVKLGGKGMNLNPMKRIREDAIGGKAIASAPGMAFAGGVGLAVGGINAGRRIKGRMKENNWNVGQALMNRDSFTNNQTGLKGIGAGINSIRRGIANTVGTTIAHGTSAGVRAAYTGTKEGNNVKGIKAGVTGVKEAYSHRADRNEVYDLNEISMVDRAKNRADALLGKTQGQKDDTKLKLRESGDKSLNEILSIASSSNKVKAAYDDVTAVRNDRQKFTSIIKKIDQQGYQTAVQSSRTNFENEVKQSLKTEGYLDSEIDYYIEQNPNFLDETGQKLNIQQTAVSQDMFTSEEKVYDSKKHQEEITQAVNRADYTRDQYIVEQMADPGSNKIKVAVDKAKQEIKTVQQTVPEYNVDVDQVMNDLSTAVKSFESRKDEYTKKSSPIKTTVERLENETRDITVSADYVKHQALNTIQGINKKEEGGKK